VAAAIPFIGAGIAALGAISQGQAQQRAGKAEEQAAAMNATIAARDAAIVRDQAKADVALLQREKVRNIGAARAQYGASGVTLDGSPLDILEQSAYNAELDKQTILYKAEVEATGYLDSAALERMRGTNARREGNARAGSTILLGGAQAVNRLPASTWNTTRAPQRTGTGYSMGDYNYDTENLA
jgi:hypothetical protein